MGREIEEYMEEFRKLLEELYELKKEKTEEYGTFTESSLGCRGLFVDMNGKLFRIRRAVWEKKYNKENDKMLEDAYKDLAIYALMSLKAFREKNLNGKLGDVHE